NAAVPTLLVGNGSSSGSISGDVMDNGNLTFMRSDAMTYAGAIHGTGTVEVQGGGTITLTGSGDYSGGTRVEAGTLIATTPDALGTRRVSVNAGTQFKLRGSGTFANDLVNGGFSAFGQEVNLGDDSQMISNGPRLDLDAQSLLGSVDIGTPSG